MNDLWSKTELKKCGLRQSKDGVVISFVLHPDDVSKELVQAPIGTRYYAALVEIAENAVRVKEKVAFTMARQAGQCCSDPRFVKFLEEKEYVNDPDMTPADVVREICGVESRRDLDTNPEAGAAWNALHGEWLGWLEL